MTVAPRKYLKATIQDVADRAGVSRTTVSHFVSGNKRACSPETAKRIRSAIEALHYAPAVRGARHQPTKAIGVCVESAANFDEWSDQRYSYMERVWSAIIREADVAGYTLLQYPAGVRYGKSADTFLNGSIDGLLIGTRRDDERLRALVSAGLPTVLLNRHIALPPGFGAVCMEERNTIDLALSHLWGLGHRRIAHLAGPVALPWKSYVAPQGLPDPSQALPRSAGNSRDVTPSDTAARRCDAYIAWMSAREAYDPFLLGFAQSWLVANPYLATEPGITENIEGIIASWLGSDDPPGAVLCANDELAFAVIRVAKRCGARVPEDLSVVGVDNRFAAADNDPPLTSVDIPAEHLARAAMRLLFRLLQGGDAAIGAAAEQIVTVPVTQLVVRHSTAAPLLSAPIK